jgi:putative hemolysin
MDLLILILLVLVNGVFALAEMAIVSSRRPRLEGMAERGSRGARTALRMLDDPAKLLSTVQIGITLANLIAGAYGATALADDLAPVLQETAPALTPYAPAIAFSLVIAFTTVLSLILGELVPKRAALAAPEQLAALMAPFMSLVATIASPVVWLLGAVTDRIVRLLGLGGGGGQDVTEEELQSMLNAGAREGVIDEQERDMIEGVMRLADRSVKAVMTPRTDMVWIDSTAPREDILQAITRSGHSRYPVAKGSVDDIVGVVQTKDLLTYLAQTGRIDIETVMHPATFVPETAPVLRLLETMRSKPVRMLFVADEYGGLLGLVTDADILEAIAGEAALDVDEGRSPAVRRDDGSWLIDGMTPIDELQQLVGARGLPEPEGYSTVAGLVMHLLRAVPREGDKVEHPPLSIEVVDMDGRRIDKVLVKVLQPVDDDPSG